MKIASALATIRRNIRNHGLQAAIHDIAVRSINKFVYMKTLECLVIEQAGPKSMALPTHLRDARLEGARLALLGRVTENELPEEFVQAALDGGDECRAIMDGSTLASYGWYSKRPTVVDGDLRLHFDPHYVYMYKGFTSKAYRGQRLYAIGMTRALNEYCSQGYKGLVAYVESNNFDSLKACYRMGYKNCGRIRVLRLANRFFIHSDQSCSNYGLELQPNSYQSAPTTAAA